MRQFHTSPATPGYAPDGRLPGATNRLPLWGREPSDKIIICIRPLLATGIPGLIDLTYNIFRSEQLIRKTA